MSGFSLYLDESFSPATDVYVIGGVIIETARVADLSAAVAQVSHELTGNKHAELKFTEPAADVRALLAERGKTIGDARAAMAAVPEKVGGIVLVGAIMIDQTADPKAGSLNPLSWSFQRSLTHFANFLGDARASTAPGSHVVTADRFPNKQHKTVFHNSYREGFEWAPFGPAPKSAGMQDFITEADATFCPPLRLADFFAGTVRAWVMAERRYDANPSPRNKDEVARPRYAMSRYLPYVRGRRGRPNQKSGYGLSVWPSEVRSQLDLWIAHARGSRLEEIFRGPSSEVKTATDGELVLSIDWGTPRSWE